MPEQGQTKGTPINTLLMADQDKLGRIAMALESFAAFELSAHKGAAGYRVDTRAIAGQGVWLARGLAGLSRMLHAGRLFSARIRGFLPLSICLLP